MPCPLTHRCIRPSLTQIGSDAVSNTLRLVQIGIRVPLHTGSSHRQGSSPERHCELRGGRYVIWFQQSVLRNVAARTCRWYAQPVICIGNLVLSRWAWAGIWERQSWERDFAVSNLAGTVGDILGSLTYYCASVLCSAFKGQVVAPTDAQQESIRIPEKPIVAKRKGLLYQAKICGGRMNHRKGEALSI